KALLEKENISTVIWHNRERIIYGLTFIDHKTKCVFNGSDLGKQYTAKAIIERCKPEMKPEENVAIHPEQKAIHTEQKRIIISPFIKSGLSNALENLSEPISSSNYIPYQLKKNRKKKKRKRLSI
ncbi:MAG: relaxase/mobilization nuclease domain-containing protein, partial [Ginsengibacter sp.]